MKERNGLTYHEYCLSIVDLYLTLKSEWDANPAVDDPEQWSQRQRWYKHTEKYLGRPVPEERTPLLKLSKPGSSRLPELLAWIPHFFTWLEEFLTWLPEYLESKTPRGRYKTSRLKLARKLENEPETLNKVLHALDRGDETYFLYLTLEIKAIYEWLADSASASASSADAAQPPASPPSSKIPDTEKRVQEAWPWKDLSSKREKQKDAFAAAFKNPLTTPQQIQCFDEDDTRIIRQRDIFDASRRWEFLLKIRAWKQAEENKKLREQANGQKKEDENNTVEELIEKQVYEIFRPSQYPPDVSPIYDKYEKQKLLSDLAKMLRESPKDQSKLALLLGKTPSRWLREEEAESLWIRRAFHRKAECPQRNACKPNPPSDVTGLCFSGGGIRSATFNLGVLQALAELHLLDKFDYLSSVSGGGYIHQWIASWWKRAAESAVKPEEACKIGAESSNASEQSQTSDQPSQASDQLSKTSNQPPESEDEPTEPPFETVRKALVAQPKSTLPGIEPTQITFLRRFSNYLTPEVGLFTGDTWTALAIWLRNTFLNQLIIASGLLTLFCLLRAATAGLDALSGNTSSPQILLYAPGACLLLYIIVCIMQWKQCSAEFVIVKTFRQRLQAWLADPRVVIPFLYPFVRMWQFTKQLDEEEKPTGKQPPRGDLYLTMALITLLVSALFFTVYCARPDSALPPANGTLECWLHRLIPGSPEPQCMLPLTTQHPVTTAIPKPPANLHMPPSTAIQNIHAALTHFFQLAANTLWNTLPLPLQRKAKWCWDVLHIPSTYLFAALILWPAFLGRAGFARERYKKSHPSSKGNWRRVQVVFTGILAGALVSFLLSLFYWILWQKLPGLWKHLVTVSQDKQTHALLRSSLQALVAYVSIHHAVWHELLYLIAPPLLLAVLFLASVLHVGLNKHIFCDEVLEWMARFRALGFLVSFTWVFVGFFAVLAGPLLASVSTLTTKTWWSLATAAWAAISGRGAFAAKDKPAADDSPIKKYTRAILIAIAPYTFIFGLFLGMAALVSVATDNAGKVMWGYWGLLFSISLVTTRLYGWQVDINEMSMHSFYRNRLARCYQGASVINRQPDAFTGFSSDDRAIRMADLRYNPPDNIQGQYPGPFPIFCCTVNFTSGEDLAWQERKGASFAYTPLYSGYDIPWTGIDRDADKNLYYSGFRDTTDLGHPHGPGLADVCAISGAAVSPAWGYHTTTGLAFLMTCFNVRLGVWRRNTRYPTHSRNSRRQASTDLLPQSPPIGLWYLLGELFGKTDAKSEFLYLTDGGHFDNMGLYELIRRECRYIVICDAEEDGDLSFEGLASAIRKCRTDFGVDINLDITNLRKQKDSEYSTEHCTVGTIRYPNDPAESEPGDRGILVYLKSTLKANDPADLLSYKLKHSEFPHDTTADQWFSESQFESYRTLGRHIALGSLKHKVQEKKSTAADSEQTLQGSIESESEIIGWDAANFPPASKDGPQGCKNCQPTRKQIFKHIYNSFHPAPDASDATTANKPSEPKAEQSKSDATQPPASDKEK